ncbi:unnamed protein product [Withania somnifera]
MEIPIETPIKKPKRLTSVVWNHFERVRKADICYAVCVHCKKKLSGSSNSGTTHLRNHLLRCLKRSNYDVSQILAAKRKKKETTLAVVTYEEGQRKEETISPVTTFKFDHDVKKEEVNVMPINLGSVRFDQERSRLDLARMIMLHGYPLSMVDHVGFKIFVKNLQPQFEVLTNSAVELDCMTIYAKEKQKVYEVIHNLHGRISLSADVWNSSENARYLCLTAFYIDEDWKHQKKMLNFITLDASHTDDILSEVVIKSLTDWAIDCKLFSMTFDHCTAYGETSFRIKDWLSQNRPLLKNGELFDVCCAIQLMKSIVSDVMESFRDVIHKVRESIRHVKSSPVTLGKFNEIAQQAATTGERPLNLDCGQQWSSTCLMLEAALDYREAFSLLVEHDSTYTSALSETEWDRAGTIAGYVKLFVEVTNFFATNKYSTANIYFPEICDIHIQLIKWCKNPDNFLSHIALKMKERFDKYWNKCSLTLALAAVLDPRYKMKLVEYYYHKIYDSYASNQIKEISDAIRELSNEYAMGSSSPDPDTAGASGSLTSTTIGARDRLRGFDKFLHETSQNNNITSDLEKYLNEPVFPRNYDFSVLNWWKVHTPSYPILSMMARDILGLPASTLGPELAFNNRGRVLDHNRSSLNPDAREALICGQDWLRMESEETNSPHIYTAVPLAVESK